MKISYSYSVDVRVCLQENFSLFEWKLLIPCQAFLSDCFFKPAPNIVPYTLIKTDSYSPWACAKPKPSSYLNSPASITFFSQSFSKGNKFCFWSLLCYSKPTYMADVLTEDQTADFQEAFCMIDKDSDGVLIHWVLTACTRSM